MAFESSNEVYQQPAYDPSVIMNTEAMMAEESGGDFARAQSEFYNPYSQQLTNEMLQGISFN
jgi:hypothetical protein